MLRINDLHCVNNPDCLPSIMTGMKKNILICGLAGMLAVSVLGGCVERTVYVQGPPPPGAVVVNEAPPTPPAEVVVAAPGPAYSWVPGYWSWQGRWVWVAGCWKARPHPHAVWVSGRWVHHPHGYYWVEGHWRQ